MQNSWYVKANGQHHFFCQCGSHETVEVRVEEEVESLSEPFKFKREEVDFRKIPNAYYPDNTCAACSNERYLDANALVFEDRTRYWSEIELEYKMCVASKGWKVSSSLTVPKFDEKHKVFTREEVELSSYIVARNGESDYNEKERHFFRKSMLVKGEYCRLDGVVKKKVMEKLFTFILQMPTESLAWLKGEEGSLDDVIFFLRNPNIRSKEMAKWRDKEHFLPAMNKYVTLEATLFYLLNHRQERSLKRIQYRSYSEMMHRGGYNPTVDYVFSQTVKDVNHLSKILEMNSRMKMKIFNGSRVVNILHFIEFLQLFYAEKHLVKFWLSINEDDLKNFLLRDSIAFFEGEVLREMFRENFLKSPLNIRAIHHELTRHSRAVEKIEYANQVFYYSDFLLSLQGEREEIEYKLPLNAETLYNWGGLLHNCIFSYRHKLMREESVIFGLFVENRLTYALEIRNYKIVQLSAIYNGLLSPLERAKVYRWFKEVYLKKSINSFS